MNKTKKAKITSRFNKFLLVITGYILGYLYTPLKALDGFWKNY